MPEGSSQGRPNQVRALASEQRLHVLRLLRDPGQHFARQTSADPVEFGVCVTHIAEALGVSQPTASRHVDLLRQAGFITVRRQGKWSYCKRDGAAMAEYLAWLAGQMGAAVDSR